MLLPLPVRCFSALHCLEQVLKHGRSGQLVQELSTFRSRPVQPNGPSAGNNPIVNEAMDPSVAATVRQVIGALSNGSGAASAGVVACRK